MYYDTLAPVNDTAINFTHANSIAEILQTRAAKTPDFRGYCFLQANKEAPACLTYAELDQKSRIIAAYLQQLKAQGERAILLFEPGLDYISSIYGCLYAKVLAVPVYPPLNQEMANHLVHIIENSKAKIILTTSTIWTKLSAFNLLAPLAKVANKLIPKKFVQEISVLSAISSIKKLQVICIDKLPADLASQFNSVTYDLDQVAYLQYTSGSTSEPKGVMVTNRNLLTNLFQIVEHYALTEADVIVSWLPPYHDMGLVGTIFSPLYSGYQAIQMSPFEFIKNPLFWLSSMSKFRGTIGCGPDFSYRLCTKKIKDSAKKLLDLSSWRIALSGSEVVHADTMIHFYQAFKNCGLKDTIFHPSYGLAEATLFVCSEKAPLEASYQTFNRHSLQKGKAVVVPPDHSAAKKLVSHGKPLANLLLKIVDSEQEIALAEGEIGEIWISGSNVVPGYWDKPAESVQLMHAKLAQYPHHDFLRTGDLGFIYENKLYLVGRSKDLIIIGGKNHYPQDLEKDVEAHIASIRPGCIAAFSVEKHHQEHIIIVAEYKTVNEGTKHEEYSTLVKEIKTLLAREQQVHVEEVVLIQPQTIPKTTSGKLQRSRCKQLYLHHQLKIFFEG